MKQQPNQILIFDTTLRDGEQSPGASMTIDEKVMLAHQLKRLGVNIIEAGFPVISEGDFEAVSRIAKSVKGPIICGLARCVEKDITAAAKALEEAENKRIHIFIATSKIHMQHKLKMEPDEVIQRAVASVKQAKMHFDDIEFSAEDATRSDPEFLIKIFSAVIEAGVTTINVPDTVGYTMPDEYAELINRLNREVKGIENVVISVHCHNDLGVATANSLAAIKNGARQVECTINGIGERSGNAALEEIVMGLKTRHDLYKEFTSIETKELLNSSRMVSQITSIQVQYNKAIVGKNAFAHESGIHQHGIIANPETYEIMRPEDVGFNGNDMVIGKHSGKHAIKQWLVNNKIKLSDNEISHLSQQVKSFSDSRKVISDADIFKILSKTNTNYAKI
ncbi:2-isopropylmalate synthase [Aliikangiella sp. IMCC44359]|uniref:2-isopropylmalate synthase n=1 Tax=Aliikangiella sp. IMCC44359 TaxID=3459125 RepID=UPI00403AB228